MVHVSCTTFFVSCTTFFLPCTTGILEMEAFSQPPNASSGLKGVAV